MMPRRPAFVIPAEPSARLRASNSAFTRVNSAFTRVCDALWTRYGEGRNP
jgi:hypothetical protein